jgi:ferredoxin-thioredoxin reductase catalytic subunit
MTDPAANNLQEIGLRYDKIKKDAEAGSYYLNPDISFAQELIAGLLVNEKRYGYPACPCRLATGNKAKDIDIICPCDYRDADIGDYGACYCSLYVSKAIVDGEKKATSIPERRKAATSNDKLPKKEAYFSGTAVPLPVWRCKVCGYLCARNQPPEICPICKAKNDRFERFL